MPPACWPENVVSETNCPVVHTLACTTSDRTTTIAVKTYRVTISPKGDISPAMIKWLQKTYADNNKYVVCEHGQSGQKHLHMLIQFDKPKQKKDLRDVLFRAIKKHHPDSNGKALVVNTCYDMAWYDEYLRKEDDREDVDTDNFDADSFRLALPDQATQTALQDAQRRQPIGAKWITHEQRWIELSPNDTGYESAIRYFNHRMCVSRDMEPYTSLRRLREEAYFLWKYRNKAVDPDYGDVAFMKKEYDGEIDIKKSESTTDANMHTLREMQLWEENDQLRRNSVFKTT